MITLTAHNQTLSIPYEISHKIFSSLDSRTMALLLTVSTTWYYLLSHNDLWKKFCPKISIKNAEDCYYLKHYPTFAGIYLARHIRKGDLPILENLSVPNSSCDCLEVIEKTCISDVRDKAIRVWDPQGTLKNTLVGHQWAVTCLERANDLILSGSCQNEIFIWNPNLAAPLLQILSGHVGSVTCLKATHAVIVSGSDDRAIRIWNFSNYHLDHVLEGHRATITCLEIIDDIIVSGAKDETMRIWDLLAGSQLYTYLLGSEPRSINFIDQTLIIGFENGKIQSRGKSLRCPRNCKICL